MKRLMAVWWATVLILMAAGCRPAASNSTQADEQNIRDLEKQWNLDYASKDSDKLAAYYADDAVLMAPGMPPSVGRDAIHATMKELVADPALTLRFTAAQIDVAGSGDLGYSRGAYVLTMTDLHTKKVVSDHGSYVTTYRKEANSQWKAVADIASSEIPPGPAPAS